MMGVHAAITLEATSPINQTTAEEGLKPSRINDILSFIFSTDYNKLVVGHLNRDLKSYTLRPC